jgi:hypothetical protein
MTAHAEQAATTNRQAGGVQLRVVEAHARVRDLVRKEVGASLGEVSRRISADDVVTDADR